MRRIRQNDWQLIAAAVNGLFAVILVHLWQQYQVTAYALASIYCSAACIVYAIQILRRYL